jgi:hypothetical protein
MGLTSTSRKWVIGGAVSVAVVLIVAVFASAGDDGGGGDDVATGTSTAQDEPSSTDGPAPPSTVPTTSITGFATPEEAVAARYGAAYIGACESVPVDGHWADDAMCSIRVDLSDSQVVVFAGPPYSEVAEDLLVRHEGGVWHVVDSYTPGEPGVEDPHMPDWVRAAGDIKDGGHE